MPDSTADLPSRLADSLTATTVWQQELIAKLLERGNTEAESGLDVALIIHDLHAQVETLTAAKVVAEQESRECCTADGNTVAASGADCADTDAAAEPDSEMQSALGLPTELVDSIRQAALASLTAIDQCREAFENGDDGKAFKCMKHAAAHMRRVIDGLKTVNNIVNGGEERCLRPLPLQGQ